VPRRIVNLRFEKLVAVVIFAGFSNGFFVGFLYSGSASGGFRAAPEALRGRIGGFPNAETAPELRPASQFRCRKGRPAASGLWLARNVQQCSQVSLCVPVSISATSLASSAGLSRQASPSGEAGALNSGREATVTQCAKLVWPCIL
jgi:hypothetical protein